MFKSHSPNCPEKQKAVQLADLANVSFFQSMAFFFTFETKTAAIFSTI